MVGARCKNATSPLDAAPIVYYTRRQLYDRVYVIYGRRNRREVVAPNADYVPYITRTYCTRA